VRGSIRQLPDGRWRIRWYTADGRRPGETYRLKSDAESALNRHVSEAQRGIAPLNPRMTLAEYVPAWEAATKPAVKPRAWEVYDLHRRRYIVPMLGRHRLAQVDAGTVQRFVDGLTRKGLAPKTVRGVYGTLSLILGMARRDGLARPVEGVRLPRVERVELVIPTPAQAEALAAAIDPRMWAMVRVAAYCGLRQGECLALVPENVDWLGRRIRVEATLNLRNQRRESPKGGRGRWVTMPTIVADSLSAHLRAHPATDYVFHRADGRPWKASRVWEAWNEARKACKLEDVDFHHLRHHAASLMIAAGWSVPRVAAELGHRDPAMTLRVYAHLWPSELDAGRNQLDAAIARMSGPPADHEARHVVGSGMVTR
jgi:integrase